MGMVQLGRRADGDVSVVRGTCAPYSQRQDEGQRKLQRWSSLKHMSTSMTILRSGERSHRCCGKWVQVARLVE